MDLAGEMLTSSIQFAKFIRVFTKIFALHSIKILMVRIWQLCTYAVLPEKTDLAISVSFGELLNCEAHKNGKSWHCPPIVLLVCSENMIM